MKYVEAQGQEMFDWYDFLERAIQDQTTEEENEIAEKMAADWVTCACGNQCDVIPRGNQGSPEDPELNILGHDFSECISSGNFYTAFEILERIEERSAQLIKEINEKS